jgi:hypothetical protein
MDIKQNPFSFYDFLGYFTPGALALYGVLASYAHFSGADITEGITGILSFDRAEIYIPFILIAYVVGHIIAFVSSITIERYSLWSTGYPSKYLVGFDHPKYFDAKESPKLRKFIRFFVAIILLPLSLMDYFIGNLLGFRLLYAKKLDPLLIKIVKNKIFLLITKHAGIAKPDEHAPPYETDFFRYVYHYAVENCPAHLPKMQNYVALYGFLRALTLLGIISFWVILIHSIFGYISIVNSITYISLCTLVTYLLYMGFVKFYRRFSLEALMAFVASYQI